MIMYTFISYSTLLSSPEQTTIFIDSFVYQYKFVIASLISLVSNCGDCGRLIICISFISFINIIEHCPFSTSTMLKSIPIILLFNSLIIVIIDPSYCHCRSCCRRSHISRISRHSLSTSCRSFLNLYSWVSIRLV